MSKNKLNIGIYFAKLSCLQHFNFIQGDLSCIDYFILLFISSSNNKINLKKSKFSESSLLIVNIVSLHSMTVNLICSGRGQNKISEDKILCFSFYRVNN